MLTQLSQSTSKPRWWHWLAIAAGVELVWFGQLYPLVPRTAAGAIILAALPLPVAGYIYVAVKALFWVADRTWPHWVRRTTSVAIAVSVGFVIFGIILAAEMARRSDFGYRFWFRG